MSDESRVWIMKRKTKRGTTHHLRWICPTEQKWKSRRVGTDSRIAKRERSKLEESLATGTYHALTKISWDAFVEDHVFKIPTESNAENIRQALIEFGDVNQPSTPAGVSFAMIEAHVAHLRKHGNAGRTINRKIAIIRRAMELAVHRGFVVANPIPKSGKFGGWQREPVEDHEVRMVTRDEETKLISAAEKLYGLKWATFILVAVETGARRGELVKLKWSRIDFDGAVDATAGPSVLFTKTKTHRERRVPLSARALKALRRLQVQTLQDAGPFGTSLQSNVTRRWKRIIAEADIPYARVHDLRATFVTRAIRAGIDAKTVQTLAGHKKIETTLRYYTAASVAKTNREAIEAMTAAS